MHAWIPALLHNLAMGGGVSSSIPDEGKIVYGGTPKAIVGGEYPRRVVHGGSPSAIVHRGNE